MNRTARLVMFVLMAAGATVLLVSGMWQLPHFGSSFHPYRDAAVPAAVKHATSNVVSAINFDMRGFDTLGEETILLASVIGAAALLRVAEDETERKRRHERPVLESTRLLGYLLLPVTLTIGLVTIAHGSVTPGGGFQGGVVVGTGVHLLYVAGSYGALQRLRPVGLVEYGEAIGAGAFACFGIATTVSSGAFLANVLPTGSFGDVFSSGSVLLLSGAVGIEVSSAVVVLLAAFLRQAIEIRQKDRA